MDLRAENSAHDLCDNRYMLYQLTDDSLDSLVSRAQQPGHLASFAITAPLLLFRL